MWCFIYHLKCPKKGEVDVAMCDDCQETVAKITINMCILKDGCTAQMCPCDIGIKFYVHN
jgi:hypothetical protein